MRTLNLTKSDVVFNQEAHTYHLGDKELKGVTGMLSAMLFKDKYAGIDEAVLKKAAAYGSGVHEAIELYHTLGIEDGSDELRVYKTMIESAGLNFEASEYLVSDNETIASSIDLVFTDKNGEVVLADIKTTYGGLDKTYLSWQLSTYAYLFEKANPGLTVDSLLGVWVRHGQGDIKPIQRISPAEIEQLIYEYANNLPCTLNKAADVPAEVTTLADAIADMELQIKTMTAERDELKEKILGLMRDNNCDKVELDGRVLITRVAATTREALDGKALKESHPDIYAQFLKTSPVKESLKITVRK